MDSSKLSFKLFVESPTDYVLEHVVPVFHSWIQNHAIKDHLLIDVADYAHVHNGPGIVLVAHEANYSLDKRAGRLGLTYERKQPLTGSLAERIRTAFDATKEAANLLTDLKFKDSEAEFRICDRLNAPNTAETFNAIRPELAKAFPGTTFEHKPSNSELFEVIIRR